MLAKRQGQSAGRLRSQAEEGELAGRALGVRMAIDEYKRIYNRQSLLGVVFEVFQ